MPIELKPKTSKTEEEAPEAKGLVLFNEDGELTLAGETLADFLAAADFTAVTESPDALPFLSNPDATVEDPYAMSEGEGDEEGGEGGDADAGDGDKEGGDDKKGDDKEDGGEKTPAETPAGDDADAEPAGDAEGGGDADAAEPIAEVALPGAVAARLVDSEDLTEMFGYYLDQLAAVEEPSLQEQAVLAVFADYRSVEPDSGIAEDKREEVAGLLKAVLSEGVVYDAAEEISEKIMTKGQRKKAARIRRKPKSGKRRSELKKRRRVEGRGAKKQKIARQHKMRSRRKQSRIKQLARESADGTLVFGLGDGINGANLKIGLAEDPNLEFTDDELIEFDTLGGNIVECPSEKCDHKAPFAAFVLEAMHKKKKAKKKDDEDDDEDDDENGGKKKEKGKKDEGMCPKCGTVVESMNLDEKGKVPPAFLKHMKKKKGEKNGDDENGGKKKKKEKGKKDEGKRPAPSHVPGAFAVAAGRPDLSEGHSLAASTLALLAPKRTLTEGED